MLLQIYAGILFNTVEGNRDLYRKIPLGKCKHVLAEIYCFMQELVMQIEKISDYVIHYG
jgi:hypothetical protein